MSIRFASRKLAMVVATAVLAGVIAGLALVSPSFAGSGPPNGSQFPIRPYRPSPSLLGPRSRAAS